MNTRRRKNISKALEAYLNKETVARDELRCSLEMIRDEESDAYENLPESIQDSERGEAMENCIDALDDFISELDDDPYYDAISDLRESIGIVE